MFNNSKHSEGCYVICFELKSPRVRPAVMIDVMCMCTNSTRVRTGVFPLKEIITVHSFVRFINHRSLKPEIFPPPVNESCCFQLIFGVFYSDSIGVSDGIAGSHRRLSQTVPLPTSLLILNIELLNPYPANVENMASS
jgi:hypothetical protein